MPVSSILQPPYPNNLGGNTKLYESTGGKRRTKKMRKSKKQSKPKTKTKRFFFF